MARLVRIRRAKALGFTLGEIAALLDADEAGGPAGIVDAAAAKLDALDAEVARLAEVRHRLRRLVGVCEAGASADCLALDVPDEHRGEVVEEP